MYRCPHCRELLGVRAVLNMSTNTLSTCGDCGQRYVWAASGPMLLLMIIMIASSTIALVMTAPRMPVVMAAVAIPTLIAASAAMALNAIRPVAR
jgi:uncharacterized protein (DUF983 family)